MSEYGRVTAMPELLNVYLGIKFHTDYSNRIRIECIMKAIAESNCQGRCLVFDDDAQSSKHPHHAFELMQRAFSNIDESQIVIIDATEKGVGIGIEAGYAFAKGIPILTIAEKDAHISETLCGISTLVGTYANPRSLRDLLLSSIRQILDAARVGRDSV